MSEPVVDVVAEMRATADTIDNENGMQPTGNGIRRWADLVERLQLEVAMLNKSPRHGGQKPRWQIGGTPEWVEDAE